MIVTGVLVRRSDGIEVCPGQVAWHCAGIRVEGAVDEAWLSTEKKAAVYRLSGVYDGTTLVLDAPAERTTLADEPDYRNSCPQFQKPTKGVNPDEQLSAITDAFRQEHQARVAGYWWDRLRQTMVVAVTGDASELQARLAQEAPKARLCIHGRARFSELELERAREKADRILRARGVVWTSSGGHVLRNQIVYELEAIDAPTRAELTREVGDAVQAVAFIELVEHTLAQLPVPPARGDVALITAKARSNASMSALGRFDVHFDAEKNCVYLSAENERVLPVWPFGYWAKTNPTRIYDYDGNLVAQEGTVTDYGGGHVEVEHVRADNTCGAKQAWIGRPERER